jgi:hypothetical protein
MTVFNSSIRAFVQTTLKNFPWAYSTQGEVIAAYADHVLAARDTSWKHYERAGIDDFTARKIQYSLLRGECHLELLKESFIKRFSKIDRREAVVISVDDTSTKRYGKKVFGAARQHDHSTGAVQHVNVLVDCWITSSSYLDYGFDVYLPKAYLNNEVGHAKDLETKIEMAHGMFHEKITALLNQQIRTERIWCTVDSWYSCGRLTTFFRESGVNFIGGLKNNATCNLFGESSRIDGVFSSHPDWHYRTDPRSGKKIYYMEKILNLPTMGRCKVFAIKRGKEKKIRYYASNRLKLTIQTFLKNWKDHWGVEILHGSVKGYFAFGGCYSGREVINLSYWHLAVPAVFTL